MKLKLLVAAVVIIVGLYFLKAQLEKKEYIPGVPAAAVPGSATANPEAGKVRQRFVVGFLPVT